MTMVYSASWGHVDVLGHVATEGHVGVHGLCCHIRPCLRAWARLPLETILVSVAYISQEDMLMSSACAAFKGYDGIYALCCDRGLVDFHSEVCGMVPMLKIMWLSMFEFPLTVKGKESTFALVSMTVDSQLRKWGI